MGMKRLRYAIILVCSYRDARTGRIRRDIPLLGLRSPNDSIFSKNAHRQRNTPTALFPDALRPLD